MRILIFNGVNSKKPNTASCISGFFESVLLEMGVEVVIFNVSDHPIPIFSEDQIYPSQPVKEMVDMFQSSNMHIWLSPLYHGGMTGAMKNCLDWLVLESSDQGPYLSNKKVGLVCWGYGGNSASGIDNMRTVANTLRAWTLPYAIPIVMETFYEQGTTEITQSYKERFERMIYLLLASQ